MFVSLLKDAHDWILQHATHFQLCEYWRNRDVSIRRVITTAQAFCIVLKYRQGYAIRAECHGLYSAVNVEPMHFSFRYYRQPGLNTSLWNLASIWDISAFDHVHT